MLTQKLLARVSTNLAHTQQIRFLSTTTALSQQQQPHQTAALHPSVLPILPPQGPPHHQESPLSPNFPTYTMPSPTIHTPTPLHHPPLTSLNPLPSPFPTPLPSRAPTPLHRTRHILPSVLMRSGTSKGLFLHRRDLPPDPADWAPILLAAMGSRSGDRRQLDGVGGATSTTSKVAVVSKSDRVVDGKNVDIDYTFAQIAIPTSRVDMSGNCGNMSAGVGPFAVDEGLIALAPGQTEVMVRIYNTNTGKVLEARFPVTEEGRVEEDGEVAIAGVPGTGARIDMGFLKPAGSMTGRVFPTGKRVEGLAGGRVRATLIDVGNPFVFLRGEDEDPGFLEQLRREAAVKMGLAADMEMAGMTRGTPKIAVLRPSERGRADVVVKSFSMGMVHPSLQLTGAVCLGACTTIRGTVAWELANAEREEQLGGSPEEDSDGGSSEGSGDVEREGRRGRRIVIMHPSGEIDATVYTGPESEEDIESVSVVRTARRLFEGNVMFLL